LSRVDDQGVGYCPMCPGVRRGVTSREEVIGKPVPLSEVLPLRLLDTIRGDRAASR
jgi:hypothetical protein